MKSLSTSMMTLAAVAMTGGCGSLGSVQRANTLGQGNVQVGIEPGVIGGAGGGAAAVGPSFDVSARGGISDKTDLGGRIGTGRYDIHMKTMFTDPESGGVVISLAPATTFFGAGGTGGGGFLWTVNLPVLIGIPTGKSQIVLGPRLINVLTIGGAGGASGTVNVLSAGSSFGYALSLGDKFGMIPEFTIAVPVVGSAANGGESGSAALGGGLLFSFKLGFLIGQQ